MWPVTGTWEPRTPGQTVIKAAWADALDAALNGLYGGSRTVKALYVDGVGYQPSALANGIQVDVNGTIVMVVSGGGISMENPLGKLSSVSHVEAAGNVKALLGDVSAVLGALRGRHLVANVNAGPTIVKSAPNLGGVGSNAQIAGSDIAGLITLTTGGGVGANGPLATVTFEASFPVGQPPREVLLIPQNGPAWGVAAGPQCFATNVTEGGFIVLGGPLPNANVDYVYGYLVVG